MIRLKHLKIRNFRRISDIELDIPESKQVICFVGNNGSGKSSILSFLVKSLYEMTTENIPSEEEKGGLVRNLQTDEIKHGEKAYGLKINWFAEDIDRTRTLLVKEPNVKNDEISDLIEEFGANLQNKWHFQNWSPKNNQNNDVISKSVVLYRPTNRFEIPSYEHKNEEVVNPTLASNWENQRLLPITVTSGLKEVERLLLDLIIDKSITPGQPDIYINRLINFIKDLNPEYKIFGVPNWPFRKVGVGKIGDLANLSSGELDLIVTAGNILAQELYIKRKHNIDNAQGVVIIDEVDSNLHPDLQERAIPLLTKHFPNIKFILTTHSPFILRSLNKENSMTVRYPDGEIFEEDFKYWWIEDVLKVVFEVDGGASKEIRDLLDKFEEELIEYQKSKDKEAINNIYQNLKSNSSRLASKIDRLIAVYGDQDLIGYLKPENSK
jgi:predicted ATP-binding protein involved in virulence